MELPFGSLQNITIMIEFASDQVNQLPIRFVNSLLSFDPAVQLSRPDLISVDRKTFASPQPLDADLNIINGYDNKVIIQLRRKRSLTTEDHQMRLTRIVGDITNPKSAGVSNAKFGIQANFVGDDTVDLFAGLTFAMNAELHVNGLVVYLGNKSAVFADPVLRLKKHFELVSNLDDDPDISHDGGRIRIRRDTLNLGETMNIAYQVAPTSGLEAGKSYRNASVNYSSLNPGELVFPDYPGKVGKLEVATCLIRENDIVVRAQRHNHLYSAIVFIFCFMIGFLLMFFILTIYFKNKRQRRMRMVCSILLPTLSRDT
uniref:Uncharacterized protein n=1 Tax=Plectus sambesii TaxID=2011161 RepID=A0A914XIL1_9BILA